MTEASDAPPELLRGVVIVANPYSGAKENRACVEALAAALRQRELESRVIWDLDELVEVAGDPCSAERYRAVVVAGGDGTLNRVINLQRQLPVFVFPLGNENLFSRELGCCGVAEHAADVIAAGRTQTIDLGRAGERLFAIVASAGFDGDAAHRLAHAGRPAAARLERGLCHADAELGLALPLPADRRRRRRPEGAGSLVHGV
jgi:diacylglycerol kinase (ATP)